jgi:hypothetical protein
LFHFEQTPKRSKTPINHANHRYLEGIEVTDKKQNCTLTQRNLIFVESHCSDEAYWVGIIQKKCSIYGKTFTTLDNKNEYCSAQFAGKANKKK